MPQRVLQPATPPPQNPAQPPQAPEVGPPQFDCDAAWKQAMQEFRLQVGPELSGKLGHNANYDTCLRKLQSGNRQSSTRPNLFRRTVNKCFHVLRTFDKAISTCCQAKAEVACLIWGTVQVFLIIAEKYRSFSQRIADMLDKVTGSLPRLEDYMAIFPTNARIQARLVGIYRTFLTFCAGALKVLNPNKFLSAVRIVFSTLDEALASTMIDMENHMDQLQREAYAAHIGMSVTHIVRSAAEQERAEERHKEVLTVFSPGRRRKGRLVNPIAIVPYLRNRTFVGRSDELDQVEAQLGEVLGEAHTESGQQSPESAGHNSPSPSITCEPRIVTICGQGGIGKTQLALELLYQNRSQYKARFWISSESKAIIEQDFAKIGHRLAVELEQPPADSTIKAAVDAALRWMETTEDSWLLVFDNVDDAKDIYEYLPKVGRGLIVVTTRDQDIADSLGQWSKENIVRLKGMDEQSSLRLLHQFIPNIVSESLDVKEDDGRIIREVLKELGGLPLCICQMGSYIQQRSCTPRQYQEMLYKKSDQLYNDVSSIAPLPYSKTANSDPQGLDRTIARCCNMSLGLLADNDRYLFGVLAFYQTDKIQEKIITENCSRRKRLKHLTNESCWNDTISRLKKHSLITIEHADAGTNSEELASLSWITPGIATCRTISIHRVLKRHALHMLSTNLQTLADSFSDAAYLLNSMFPDPGLIRVSSADKKWFQSDLMLPHVISLKTSFKLTHGESTVVPTNRVDRVIPSSFVDLLDDCSWYMYYRGSHSIHEIALGAVDSVVDALQFARESLEIGREYHKQGESDGHNGGTDTRANRLLLNVVDAVSSLCGRTFMLRGEACDYVDELIDLRERIYNAETDGNTTPNYTARNNLLICYTNVISTNMIARRWEKAQILLERAEEISRALDETRSPYELADVHFHRAQMRFHQGRHSDALEDFQKAVALFTRAFGPEHHLTLYYRSWYAKMEGAVHTERGLLLEQEVLDDRIRIFEPGGTLEGVIHYNISSFQHQLGQLDDALLSIDKAITTLAEIRDTEKHLARAYFRKKLICDDLGQHDEAAKAHELAKYNKNKVIGEENHAVILGDSIEDYDLLVRPWD